MSVEATGAPAPAESTTPAISPAAVQSAAQTPAVSQEQPADPEWLPGRLNQAKKSAEAKLLESLGAKDAATLKQRLARLDELEAASLTEAERTAKRIAELEPKAQKAERLESFFNSAVEAKFSALSEAQRAAIDAKANGDAEKRWELMTLLESFTAGQAPVAPPAVPPRPASTLPADVPKPPTPLPQAQTPRQKYETMKQTDPMGANLFYTLNKAAIESSPST